MSKADMSLIKSSSSKNMYDQLQQLPNLQRQSNIQQNLQKSIKPLSKQMSSHFQLTDSVVIKRKHRLFEDFTEDSSSRQFGNSHVRKTKIQFKIPSNQEYYIKQSREYIVPNKVHRFSSLIQDNCKDQDKKMLQSVKIDSLPDVPKPAVKQQESSMWWVAILCLMFVSIIGIFFVKMI